MFSHPNISFFHLLVNVFCVTSLEELKASASSPSANEPAKEIIFVHTVELKPMIKPNFSGRMVSSGISDVAFSSVHSEKTRLKKLMIIIIIMKKSQETTVFSGHQKLTSTMKLRSENDDRLQI